MLKKEYVPDLLWDKAKVTADSLGKSTDWATIMDIYFYLGGKIKRLYAIIEDGTPVQVIARLNDFDTLVLYRDKLRLVNSEEVFKARKQFKDLTNPMEISKNVPIDIRQTDTSTAYYCRELKQTLIIYKEGDL